MAQQNLLLKIISSILALTLWSSICSAESNVKFQKGKIKIQDQTLDVDVASTTEQQMRGLMYVKKIPNNYGMMFVYKDVERRGFWMKNTLIPLSIGFFDENKKLVEVRDMQPMKTFLDPHIDSIVSEKPAQFALEVNQGWFKNNKIKIGSTFKWIVNPELNSKSETKSEN